MHPARFEKNLPIFVARFQARAAVIFNELQSAWSSLDWERARPHETDNLSRCTILDQRLSTPGFAQYARPRGDLRDATIKIKEDRSTRDYVEDRRQGFDYTTDSNGRVVAAHKMWPRSWASMDIIRNRHAKPQASRADLNCPNWAPA